MATKTTARKKPTSHRKPAVRKAPKSGEEKRVERIKREMEDAEREMAGFPPLAGGVTRTGARPKPLRKRVASKIKGRKVRHYVARGLVHLVIGTAVGGVKTAKVAGIATGKGGAWAGRKTKTHVVGRAQRRKWTSHTPMTTVDADGKRRLARTSTVCLGCGEKHTSVQDMNRHFLDKHKNETPEARTERKLPTIHKGATAKTAGKTIVKPHPESKGPARHRATRRNPSKIRSAHLVAAYGKTINEIGAHSMATGGPASGIARGFKQWAETVPHPNKHNGVLDVQEMMASFEKAMLEASESIDSAGKALRAANIDSALVNPMVLNVQTNLEEAGARMTRFLADFEDLYALAIAWAKQSVSTPSAPFFGARAS